MKDLSNHSKTKHFLFDNIFMNRILLYFIIFYCTESIKKFVSKHFTKVKHVFVVTNKKRYTISGLFIYNMFVSVTNALTWLTNSGAGCAPGRIPRIRFFFAPGW